MKQPNIFRIITTWDKKTRFIMDNITITVSRYSYENGKHQIDNPETAIAQYELFGKKHVVKNTKCVSTIENWLFGELLPKTERLKFL